MPQSQRPRKAHRPRPVTADTMLLARSRAAKPPAADRAEMLGVLKQAHTALRQGCATELQWGVLAGGVEVAKAIEQQGVVRGLSEHLDAADHALRAVHLRTKRTPGAWRQSAMHWGELDAVATFVDLHIYQINQLGRAELMAALTAAARRIRAGGDVPLVARHLQKDAE